MRAEREHYFDGGVEQMVAHGFKVGIDAYYKIKRNLLDEGQFGPSLVLSPFNYAKGYAWGVELSTSYTRGALDLYANVARGQEKGTNIVSSQYFFAPDELDYISNHYIFTDHSQRWTASGGGSATVDDGIGTIVPSVDFLYGDGLRADDPAGIVPNGGKLPSYFTANVGITQNIDGPGALKGLSIRFDVTNLFDRIYLLRDGSGVGVGGTAIWRTTRLLRRRSQSLLRAVPPPRRIAAAAGERVRPTSSLRPDADRNVRLALKIAS